MSKRQAIAPKRNKNKAQRAIFANGGEPNAILHLNQLSRHVGQVDLPDRLNLW